MTFLQYKLFLKYPRAFSKHSAHYFGVLVIKVVVAHSPPGTIVENLHPAGI